MRNVNVILERQCCSLKVLNLVLLRFNLSIIRTNFQIRKKEQGYLIIENNGVKKIKIIVIIWQIGCGCLIN
jgi:hypothetical protein